MATQAQASPQSQYQWANNRNNQASAGGIIGQIFAVFTRPASFFQRMPYTRHWLFAALVVLGAAGYAAVNQTSTVVQTSTATPAVAALQAPVTNVSELPNNAAASSTSNGASNNASNGASSNLAPPASSANSSASANATINNSGTTNAATNTTGNSTNATTGQASTGNTASGTGTAGTSGRQFGARGTTAATGTTTAVVTTTTSIENTSASVLVLLAVGGILATWFGQALLLSLVPMLNGYAPSLGRSFQIAVWASLPLAVMLILRQVNFAAGGTGGSLGLSVLLTQWSGYSKLGDLAQRIITTFMNNLTFFWLWSLALLYIGARYVLKGNRLSAVLVIVAWVTISSIVPALITTPVASITPKPATTVSTGQSATTTTGTTNAAQQGSTTNLGTLNGGTGAFPAGGSPSGNGAPTGNSNNTNRTNRTN